MTTVKEQLEFFEKFSLLKIVFPNIPEVSYFGRDDEKKNELKVMTEGKVVEIKHFNEILVVGNTVLNTAGNSVTKNLEIIVRVMLSMNCQGFIGYLV